MTTSVTVHGFLVVLAALIALWIVLDLRAAAYVAARAAFALAAVGLIIAIHHPH